MNIQHAIILKECDGSNVLRSLHERARSGGLHDAVFTRDMLETTNDTKVKEATADKAHDQIEYLGVLLFGAKSEVAELTKSFPLAN